MKTGLALQESLTPWLDTGTRTVGVFAWHSKRGEMFAHNSEQFFYLLSTYKVPIAVQCLRLVDEGILKLDQWVEVLETDIPLTSPILDLRHFSYPGVRLHLKNLLRLMLEYSDNTASDIVLRLAGGIPAVKKFLDEYHFSKEISIDLSVAEAFLIGKETDLNDAGTPRAMTNFLIQLNAGKFLSAISTEFMLGCMQRCKTGNGRIRALLPADIIITSKTGTLSGMANDIAIIDLPQQEGKLFLAIYLKDTTASLKELENVIANIAKIIFDFTISPI
jgi:beta-lactamase class A